MNIAELSIKRPIFITCIFILILTLGGISLSKLGVDLFPDITFPIVFCCYILSWSITGGS